MSDERENPQNQEVLPPLPEGEEDRDLILFKRWLKGATFEALAVQAGVSTTQIYRIAKAKGWKKWSKRRQERKYRKAAAEIDRDDDRGEKAKTLELHDRVLGEWCETIITFPKGSNIYPGV